MAASRRFSRELRTIYELQIEISDHVRLSYEANLLLRHAWMLEFDEEFALEVDGATACALVEAANGSGTGIEFKKHVVPAAEFESRLRDEKLED